MNFYDAILEPHDLTCARLAAFCRCGGLSDYIIETLPLSGIVRAGQSRNNLRPLDHLRCRMGVYVFQLGCRAQKCHPSIAFDVGPVLDR